MQQDLDFFFSIIARRSIQGLYNKFQESGHCALTMHFPLVFVTGGWRGNMFDFA